MADVPNTPNNTPEQSEPGFDLGGLLGGIGTALAGGLTAAAGPDIFAQFMQNLREMDKKDPREAERQLALSVAKAELAFAGADVSGINNEADVAVARMKIGQRDKAHARGTAQLAESAEALQTLHSGFLSEQRPMDATYLEQMGLIQRQADAAMATIRDNAGPNADAQSQMNAWSLANSLFPTVEAHSEGMKLGTLVDDPKAFAETWAGMGEQARQAAPRNPDAARALQDLDANLSLLYSLPQGPDGAFIGTGPQVAAREALQVQDANGNTTLMSRAEVMQSPEAMTRILKLGSAEGQATALETARTEQEAAAHQTAWLGALGYASDKDYRGSGGEFDAVRATEDFAADVERNIPGLSPEKVIAQQKRMEQLMAQAPDEGTRKRLQQVSTRLDEERIRRRSKEPDYADREYEATINASMSDFKAELSRQGRFNQDTPRSWAEWAGPVGTRRVEDPGLGEKRFFSVRAQEVFATDLGGRIDQHNAQMQDPLYRQKWESLTRYEQEALLYDGRLPEFDREGVLESAREAVLAPLQVTRDYEGEIRQLSNEANLAELSGSPAYAQSLRDEAGLKAARAKTAATSQQALEDFGALARDFWDDEKIEARLMSQYTKLGRVAMQLDGQTAKEQAGLQVLSDDMSLAANADEAGRVFLKGLVRAQVNAAQLQLTRQDDFQSAQAEMTKTLSSIEAGYESLLAFKDEEGLTDAQMAELLGAETPEQWWRPFFEAL